MINGTIRAFFLCAEKQSIYVKNADEDPKIDRGGGGPIFGNFYSVDSINLISIFQEGGAWVAALLYVSSRVAIV